MIPCCRVDALESPCRNIVTFINAVSVQYFVGVTVALAAAWHPRLNGLPKLAVALGTGARSRSGGEVGFMREPAQENKKAPNLGGRPRVRSGDEVQVTVEFPLRDYARLAGYVECRKLEAIRRKGSVANQSKRAYCIFGPKFKRFY